MHRCLIPLALKNEVAMEIPKHLLQRVVLMPKSSYGVSRVVVTLGEATTIRDLLIACGKEIVKLGTREEFPFDPAYIVDVQRNELSNIIKNLLRWHSEQINACLHCR
jgi:hypothetical protein